MPILFAIYRSFEEGFGVTAEAPVNVCLAFETVCMETSPMLNLAGLSREERGTGSGIWIALA